MTALHDKYRPNTLDEVIGHSSIIRSLDDVIAKQTSQAFLFAGPSGTGKTTIARIVAKMFGVKPGFIYEIDAASNSGVDNMRDVVETARYANATAPRAYIIDECHRLSAQAWDALLAITEEPKAGMIWLFATTELKKVPKAIRTRCVTYELQPLADKHIGMLVEDTAQSEGMKDIFDDIVDVIVEHAQGSPRQALTDLATVASARDAREAEMMLTGASADADVIDLIRLLDDRGSWGAAMKLVTILKDKGQSPEGIRIVVSNYMGKVAMNTAKPGHALAVLRAFAGTYNTGEGWAPLMLSIDEALNGKA